MRPRQRQGAPLRISAARRLSPCQYFLPHTAIGCPSWCEIKVWQEHFILRDIQSRDSLLRYCSRERDSSLLAFCSLFGKRSRGLRLPTTWCGSFSHNFGAQVAGEIKARSLRSNTLDFPAKNCATVLRLLVSQTHGLQTPQAAYICQATPRQSSCTKLSCKTE